MVNGGGRVQIADNVTLGFSLATDHHLPVLPQAREPGAVVEARPGVALVGAVKTLARQSVKIGAGTLVGPRCVVFDTDLHEAHLARRREQGSIPQILIGRRRWLGYEAFVLKGVVIGERAGRRSQGRRHTRCKKRLRHGSAGNRRTSARCLRRVATSLCPLGAL